MMVLFLKMHELLRISTINALRPDMKIFKGLEKKISRKREQFS